MYKIKNGIFVGKVKFCLKLKLKKNFLVKFGQENKKLWRALIVLSSKLDDVLRRFYLSLAQKSQINPLF